MINIEFKEELKDRFVKDVEHRDINIIEYQYIGNKLVKFDD